MRIWGVVRLSTLRLTLIWPATGRAGVEGVVKDRGVVGRFIEGGAWEAGEAGFGSLDRDVDGWCASCGEADRVGRGGPRHMGRDGEEGSRSQGVGKR